MPRRIIVFNENREHRGQMRFNRRFPRSYPANSTHGVELPEATDVTIYRTVAPQRHPTGLYDCRACNEYVGFAIILERAFLRSQGSEIANFSPVNAKIRG